MLSDTTQPPPVALQARPADAVAGRGRDRAGADRAVRRAVPGRVPRLPAALPGQQRAGEVGVQGAPRAQGEWRRRDLYQFAIFCVLFLK